MEVSVWRRQANGPNGESPKPRRKSNEGGSSSIKHENVSRKRTKHSMVRNSPYSASVVGLVIPPIPGGGVNHMALGNRPTALDVCA